MSVLVFATPPSVKAAPRDDDGVGDEGHARAADAWVDQYVFDSGFWEAYHLYGKEGIDFAHEVHEAHVAPGAAGDGRHVACCLLLVLEYACKHPHIFDDDAVRSVYESDCAGVQFVVDSINMAEVHRVVRSRRAEGFDLLTHCVHVVKTAFKDIPTIQWHLAAFGSVERGEESTLPQRPLTPTRSLAPKPRNVVFAVRGQRAPFWIPLIARALVNAPGYVANLRMPVLTPGQLYARVMAAAVTFKLVTFVWDYLSAAPPLFLVGGTVAFHLYTYVRDSNGMVNYLLWQGGPRAPGPAPANIFHIAGRGPAANATHNEKNAWTHTFAIFHMRWLLADDNFLAPGVPVNWNNALQQFTAAYVGANQRDRRRVIDIVAPTMMARIFFQKSRDDAPIQENRRVTAAEITDYANEQTLNGNIDTKFLLAYSMSHFDPIEPNTRVACFDLSARETQCCIVPESDHARQLMRQWNRPF